MARPGYRVFGHNSLSEKVLMLYLYALLMTVILRAHHLLCLRGFVGMGYNEEFVQNMTQIKERLESGEGVIIVDTCDDICGSCPNIKDDVCQITAKFDSLELPNLPHPVLDRQNVKNSISGPLPEEEMQRMDRAVVELADLKIGEECTYSELRQIVDVNIPPQDMKGVCGECRWLEHCEKVDI